MARLRRALTLTAAAAVGLYAYGAYAVRRFENLDPESAGAPGQIADIDGIRLHYIDAGQGDPVVLVHGLNASTFTYRYTVPELSRKTRVIAIDLLGFGYSGRPVDADYSLSAHADRLARLLDHLGIKEAAVAGHSMGGGVAMHFALRYPERVTRLVLVDSVSDHELRRGRRASRFSRVALPLVALLFHRRWFRRAILRTAVHDPAHLTPEYLEQLFRTSRMRGHLRALGLLSAHRAKDPPIDAQEIGCPTLVMWGEHDRWLPSWHGEELAASIPDASFKPVWSAGHLPLEEQPDLSNVLLIDFLCQRSETTPASGEGAPASTTN
jgi:pimeloyl-ACP methyl ester carboxylesterase